MRFVILKLVLHGNEYDLQLFPQLLEFVYLFRVWSQVVPYCKFCEIASFSYELFLLLISALELSYLIGFLPCAKRRALAHVKVFTAQALYTGVYSRVVECETLIKLHTEIHNVKIASYCNYEIYAILHVHFIRCRTATCNIMRL